MKLTRAHVIISGWVTGVNFRYFVKLNAIELGLTGWVRNLDNGQVEAIFEGPEDKIKDMIILCKQGPPVSKVRNVKVTFSEYKGEFSAFERR